MAFNQIHRLDLSWTTSKARDTYGYNIARLDDSISGKRYKTCGGGYDMIGTVLADWFQDQHQSSLINLFEKNKDKANDYASTGWKVLPEFYGMHYRPNDNKVALDGACGVESILRIIEACGFEVQRSHNKKVTLQVFYVQAV